jgi:hypothetical protein
LPDELLQRWEADDFTLVTSSAQLDELQRVLSYGKLQRFIRPEQAAKLVENLRSFAVVAEGLPDLNVSSDTADNVIIATAIAGTASHLVTGDKADLLSLKWVNNVAIITVREAIQLLASQSELASTTAIDVLLRQQLFDRAGRVGEVGGGDVCCLQHCQQQVGHGVVASGGDVLAG